MELGLLGHRVFKVGRRDTDQKSSRVCVCLPAYPQEERNTAHLGLRTLFRGPRDQCRGGEHGVNQRVHRLGGVEQVPAKFRAASSRVQGCAGDGGWHGGDESVGRLGGGELGRRGRGEET